ncbi:MAG: hypothetical protein R3B54_13580 [Bdellovibrionota bacterium]
MSDSSTLWCVDVYAVEPDGETTYMKSIYYRRREAAMARAIEVNAQKGLTAVIGSSNFDVADSKIEFADQEKPAKGR